VEKNKTYQIVYKCRQCGLEFSPIDGNFKEIFEFLCKSIGTHANRLYAIHTCEKDECGIADLIGMRLIK